MTPAEKVLNDALLELDRQFIGGLPLVEYQKRVEAAYATARKLIDTDRFKNGGRV